ncbi:zinc-dependent alcohol dehydrogenase [Glacieibacterium megasporae]|uniref:zinc-dependent alcohol dehydrogenase n=1 Tax=Glacieibacterium megasporae TaxID=2835787 RepID=UPI001C1E63EC|nr:alcohol dehydrogenase catalytic domain-containing protein [Polymorphobacter megasporae]UAJ09106.1 alcohol dehydrogenase catalytic domain-containing protein [Polymorphobacter megasporae]
MRAARLFGPADLRVVDLPVPVPGPGEVLVRVHAYAPYGTDVGVYLNRGARYVSEYPVGVGADFSGTLAAIGEGVSGFTVGERVAALALDHCGVCSNCAGGRTNLCLDSAFAVPVRQACCEDYAIVAARKLAAVPDGVGFEDAAMLAGIVDALNAFDKMGLAPGDHVAVVGVGAMGLGAIATARALDLNVVAVGGSGARADLAAQLGASRVFPIKAHDEDLAGYVRSQFPGGCAAVMETTASAWGMRQAFAIAAPGGIVALTGGGELPVSSWAVVDRELRIVGVRAGTGQAEAMRLIADGKLDLKPSIGARFTLEQAPEAFALLTSDAARDIGRVIITMDAGA